MATDSFTSSALGVSSTKAVVAFGSGFAQFDEQGFYVRIGPNGVYATKAASFGAGQAALAFPLTRQQALSLAKILLRVAN